MSSMEASLITTFAQDIVIMFILTLSSLNTWLAYKRAQKILAAGKKGLLLKLDSGGYCPMVGIEAALREEKTKQGVG